MLDIKLQQKSSSTCKKQEISVCGREEIAIFGADGDAFQLTRAENLEKVPFFGAYSSKRQEPTFDFGAHIPF